MSHFSFIPSLDTVQVLAHWNGELQASAAEDRKVTKIRVQAQSEQIREKRQARLSTLQEQIEASSKSGGCVKFFAAIFKVFDLLTKPLSAITGGQLQLELGGILEQLRASRLQHRVLGLKIDGGEMRQALQSLKSLFQEDLARLRDQDEQSLKSSERILALLSEIQDAFPVSNPNISQGVL